MELLLELGDIDPTLSDEQGLTPLTQAARTGHQNVVELLLERRDVNADPRDEDRWTPLSYAADLGH